MELLGIIIYAIALMGVLVRLGILPPLNKRDNEFEIKDRDIIMVCSRHIEDKDYRSALAVLDRVTDPMIFQRLENALISCVSDSFYDVDDLELDNEISNYPEHLRMIKKIDREHQRETVNYELERLLRYYKIAK